MNLVRGFGTLRGSSSLIKARALHASASNHAFSQFLMPAMSPTMTEGGLATWKVQEGQSFSSGDVLLEIETDKATMDVEAQDDGIMAKIVVQAGEKNIGVGKLIAILAEEGDDLSKAESEISAQPSQKASSSDDQAASSSSSPSPSQDLSTRQESSSLASDTNPADPSAPTPPPSHSAHGTPDFPMFPSVLRLLNENHISPSDAKNKIKGTGIRGMLTKGDVLVHLGKVSSPTGSYRDVPSGIADLGGPPSGKANAPVSKPVESKPLTAHDLRSAIISGLALNSRSQQSLAASARSSSSTPSPTSSVQRDALSDALSDYTRPTASPSTTGIPHESRGKRDWLEGLL